MTTRTLPALPLLTFALLLSLPGTAAAVDGVIEINHARALAGGVTPGDTPGYPVTISRMGSYRLTGNLTQPDPNTHIILVTADQVTIDLNGFTLAGACQCEAQMAGQRLASVTCAPLSANSASGAGVYAVSQTGTVVRNGQSRGISGYAIFLGSHSTIDQVIVQWSSKGLRVDDGSRVTSVSVSQSGFGIEVGEGSTVSSSSVFKTGHGIYGTNGSVFKDLTVRYVNDYGIKIDFGSGIVSGSTVQRANGSGIETAGVSLVHDCVSTDNTGYGLLLPHSSGQYHNTVMGNTQGGVFQGISLGAGVCQVGAEVQLCP